MQVSFKNKETHLVATTTGTMRSDDIPRYAAQIIGTMRIEGLTRVLMDELILIQAVDMLDAYEISESDEIASAVMDGFRAACVVTPENLSISKAFETSFRNRSLNFKVFMDTETALAWLLT